MDKILTVSDIAELLKVKPMTVRVMFREQRLRGFKIGKSWRTTEKMFQEDVTALLSGRKPATLPAPKHAPATRKTTKATAPPSPTPDTPPPAPVPEAAEPDSAQVRDIPLAEPKQAEAAPDAKPKKRAAKPKSEPMRHETPNEAEEPDDTQQLLF